MTEDLTKKAAEMLLNGATLLGQPCPYCGGVRVMKEGFALCISCGKKPEKKDIPKAKTAKELKSSLGKMLEEKLQLLSKELENERDHGKQQNILKSMNSILETLDKIKG